MKYLLAAVLTALSIGTADAATFEAEIKGNTVTVYSSSKKSEACVLKNTFSYVVEGKRYTTTQVCNVQVVPGDRVDVCHATSTDINQAKIEKPVEVVSCEDSKK